MKTKHVKYSKIIKYNQNFVSLIQYIQTRKCVKVFELCKIHSQKKTILNDLFPQKTTDTNERYICLLKVT